MLRSAGLLLHPTALYTPYAIGDLGPAAYEWVDFLHNSQQRWWQMLPIGPSGPCQSPYDGPSAFAGNPLLISPEKLYEDGWLSRYDLDSCQLNTACVNYAHATEHKSRRFRIAYDNFVKQAVPSTHYAFEQFCQIHAAWLDDYALFTALSAIYKKPWVTWEEHVRQREPAALAAARHHFNLEIQYQQFVQWQFEKQWQELKQYCTQKQIQLLGDIPLFVAHHSADVWAHPHLFKLNATGQPIVVAGVPPDYFSHAGQNWHVPVYDWTHMQAEHFAWWIARTKHALSRFDSLRLDHFIGYEHIYEISANATDALQGQYHASGGLALFKTLESTLGDLPFIAEDLGSRTSAVDELRSTMGIPGMQVVQFDLEAYLGDAALTLPQYETNTVLYTGTHDNNTLLGWWHERTEAEQLQLLATFSTGPEQIVPKIITWTMQSAANIVILPVQDLLGLASNARFNYPGIALNNWTWRLEKNAPHAAHATWLRQITQESKRI